MKQFIFLLILGVTACTTPNKQAQADGQQQSFLEFEKDVTSSMWHWEPTKKITRDTTSFTTIESGARKFEVRGTKNNWTVQGYGLISPTCELNKKLNSYSELSE